MKRVAMCVLCIVFILMPYMTLADSNASNLKPAQDQPRPQSVDEKNGTSVIGTKLPLDIISTGSDQSGTLLSYKLKEELMASKLFTLTAAEKKKFVLHLQTQPEFSDRPSIASIYSIALVYQEDSGTLTYYLSQLQGQVHADGVAAEMQKILEWTYSKLKRYHYLLSD
ncbi:MAG: hypothetical protein GXY42_07640 [Desulfovibrionales bacterium]|nr:hypothetical protein [Desulfovibrionales bacterium]